MCDALSFQLNHLMNYSKIFDGKSFFPIQKAYTTPHFIVLGFRIPQKTLFLYIGRGDEFVGCFLSEIAPPSYLRVQDKFLDYVRKYLVGGKLNSVSLRTVGPMTRIFLIEYRGIKKVKKCYLGYIERKLFFAHQEDEESSRLKLSTNSHNVEESLFLEEIQGYQMSLSGIIYSKTIEKYIEIEKAKASGEKVIKKREKFLIKKRANIENDLKLTKNWQSIQGVVVDMESDPGPVFEYLNFKHEFKGEWGLFEKKDQLFRKIKKLKRAESILIQRLEEVESELSGLQSGRLDLTKTKEKTVQILWGKHERSQKKSNASSAGEGCFKNVRIGKFSGYLGINSEGNDQIRKISSDDFWWFHLEGETGAHLIIRTSESAVTHPQYLEKIASLLKDKSSKESSEMSLMYTQVKNIKGVKGSVGKVSVKKAKYFKCFYRDWNDLISIE